MKQRAPKRPAQERRQMILDGAQSVFAATGYANAGTEDIARAAGVAPSAIYRYYPSKRDLYLAALRDAGPRLLSLWKSVAAKSADPLETLWQVGLDYYDHVQGRSPYAQLWFQALGDVSDPDVRTTVAANFTATVDLLSQQLDVAQASGTVRQGIDTRIAAWHFMAIGLTFDLVHHLGIDEELDRAKVEEWGRLYIDSLREERHAAIEDQPGVRRRGTVRVRQSGGDGVTVRRGDPVPAVPPATPDPLVEHGGRAPPT